MFIPQQRQAVSVLYFHQADYSPKKMVIKGITVYLGLLPNQEKKIFSVQPKLVLNGRKNQNKQKRALG